MFRIFIMVAILVAAYIHPQNLIALDAPAKAAQPTFEEYVLTYTTLFGSDKDTVYSVGLCESGGKWIGGDFRNGVYHSFGQYQYFTETWNRYAQLYRATYGVDDQFDIRSMHDQVKLTAYVFSLGEQEKKEWSTYVAITKGGTYTFYSTFHHKWYTVKCSLTKIPTRAAS